MLQGRAFGSTVAPPPLPVVAPSDSDSSDDELHPSGESNRAKTANAQAYAGLAFCSVQKLEWVIAELLRPPHYGGRVRRVVRAGIAGNDRQARQRDRSGQRPFA